MANFPSASGREKSNTVCVFDGLEGLSISTGAKIPDQNEYDYLFLFFKK